MSGHPTVTEVVELYARASAEPPLSEDHRYAETYGRLYGAAQEARRAITASVRSGDGRLVGFAYGEPWAWSDEPDGWESELRERAGSAAAMAMASSTSVNLLAVDPAAQRGGLGTHLLGGVLGASAGPWWLLTNDMETPAMRLYHRAGFERVGVGPVSSNGLPAALLFRSA
jgi:GNAT superfamily N-acetyltransferase